MSRRFLAPEVVQTSAMDCGPASLKCLLEGFGVPVSYGRLRDACQTDVDGTSIDTIEEIAQSLGLDCEQVMMPVDHFPLHEADAFPAIVVVRLPTGFTHFVVAWRRLGSAVQLMDPLRGRYWTSEKRFLEDVYVHTASVPASAFSEWVRSDEYGLALRARLRELGCAKGCRAEIDAALADEGWRSLALLDGSIRMTSALVRAGGLRRGREAAAMIGTAFRRACAGDVASLDTYLTARPAPRGKDDETEESVLLRGAVLVRVKGRFPAAQIDSPEDRSRSLSPDLVAALAEPTSGVGRHLLTLLRADGALALPFLAAALLGAVIAAAMEAALFRSIFELGPILGLLQHRLAAMTALVALALVLLLLEVPIAAGVIGLGRRLDVRLRLAFLDKIPRLGDRYFRSRPMSDMAERCHAIHDLRLLPDLGAQIVRILIEMVVTAAAIAWVDRASAPWAMALAAISIGAPLAAQPVIIGRDLRVRTHLGAIARCYLDALQGLVPIRTHGAEGAVRREHEALLVEWKRAAFQFSAAAATTEGLQLLGAYAMIVPLLISYASRTNEAAGVLLLLYWALNLPVLGRDLATVLRQYPTQRNRTVRLLEPLGAPEGDIEPTETGPSATPEEEKRGDRFSVGVSLVFEQVGVVAAGHPILNELDLWIESGSHIAIVGASGSGKSSFLGTLLGWHRPSAGKILVDGQPLNPERLAQLRRETAWVDPAVQLWNRSLFENLCYGLDRAPSSLAPLLEAAELHEVLEALPDGLQTSLGEGGALVSGGEGQRVRLGRALGKATARLVLLDEPFRGLDRERRHRLIERARAWWHGATLLCVTHDIAETRSFDRVLVIEAGSVVEDGTPEDLAAQPGSRYAAMLREEEDLREHAWSGSVWRRVRLESGRLRA